jgi:hypothetical protein
MPYKIAKLAFGSSAKREIPEEKKCRSYGRGRARILIDAVHRI